MPKNPAQGKCEPAQPRLPGTNLARFLCESCPFDTRHKTLGRKGELDPNAEVVESSPSAVPPVSNTGVHHEPSKRGASSPETLS